MRRFPRLGERTYSPRDGEGRVTDVSETEGYVYVETDEGRWPEDLGPYDFEWDEANQRWTY